MGESQPFHQEAVHQGLNMLFFYEAILDNETCDAPQIESKIYNVQQNTCA